jgi:hypothetical protein
VVAPAAIQNSTSAQSQTPEERLKRASVGARWIEIRTRVDDSD